MSWRTVNGTATAGRDYVANSGVLQFSPGTVSQEVIISIVGDPVPEPPEGFTIQLSGATGAILDPTYKISGITIQDDDGTARHCPGATRLQGNHFVGTSASETLRGTPHRDIICGLGGNDRLRGLGGHDVLLGGAGNDALLAGAGNDLLRDDAGNDNLNGAAGRDTCNGGSGKNVLKSCERSHLPSDLAVGAS